MTGKLIKYEIKSSGKLIAIIWAALIAASLMFSLADGALTRIMPEGFEETNIAHILVLITGLMFFAVFVAMITATAVIIILRFYKGLLGEEGYLMHTLPVKPWQLITSKGIVAAGMVAVSLLVAILAIFIVAGFPSGSEMAELFRGLGKRLGEEPIYILIAAEILLILILGLLKSIYQIYASLAIGQLVGKHRIILSIGAYIGINILMTILFLIVTMIGEELGVLTWLSGFFYSEDYTTATQLTILGLFAATALQLAAFHIVTERILSKKLNLQ